MASATCAPGLPQIIGLQTVPKLPNLPVIIDGGVMKEKDRPAAVVPPRRRRVRVSAVEAAHLLAQAAGSRTVAETVLDRVLTGKDRALGFPPLKAIR